MKFLIKKHFGKLIPVYNSDAERLKDCRLKEGEIYEVEIKKKRNVLYHRKWHSLANLYYDNQDIFTDYNKCWKWLVIESGFVEEVKTPKGIEIVRKSVSFDSMDDIEFHKLYQKTIDVICRTIDVEEKDLMNEIVEYM